MRQITLKKPVASVSSLGGSARVVFAATFACFMSAASLSAQGSTNVFNDAVFWFRGGKDCVAANGYLQQGEFFDDLHADASTHDNHKMSMSTSYYTGDYAGFRANAVLRSEPVVFPALGKGVVKNMRVLRISNVAVKPKGIEKNYYFPLVVNPYSIFERYNISNQYTIVCRIRMDDNDNRDECLFRIGYDSSNSNGLYLAFAKSPQVEGTIDIGSRYIKGRCTPNSESGDTSFNFPIRIPTNTWVDVAAVVGDGRLRVGIAVPESLANHGNNSTIAFAETPMWTDNCPLLGDGKYRLFCANGQTAPKEANAADQTCFVGCVQQLAIWGKALTDQEVMEAFGMPRPALLRIGFDNENSHEFGGTRPGASQTIDGLGSWQNIANTMEAGDTWTVNFTALRDEAGLPQIFSIKSLPDSATAMIEPRLNNHSLGVMRIARNGRAFWPVPKDLITAGENTLVIERKNFGGRDFKMDAMELGGSLGVGKETQSGTDDQRTTPDRTATGVPSAADPNTQHWLQGLQPYKNNITNLHFCVWVDPDVVDKATSRFWTETQCADRNSTQTIHGDEEFRFYVNGVQKATRGCDTSWTETAVEFVPGELKGGWNDFEFIAPKPYTTCHWFFGYYRFETVLPSAFSFPPLPGLSIFIR